MRKLVVYLILLSFLGIAHSFAGKAKAPEWVESLRKMPVPDWAKKEPVIIYSSEEMVDISKGKARSRIREAIKPMTSPGLSS